MPNINVGTLEADMESTSLHELGHAHMLVHTINSDNVMARPAALDFRRNLTTDDENGGIHLSLLGNNTNGCAGNLALINPSECDVTSVVEINGKEISVSVFPNPASTFINIQFDQLIEPANSFIDVIDVNGRSVRSLDLFGISNKTFKIDASDIYEGLYFVQLRNSKEVQLIGKFTKID